MTFSWRGAQIGRGGRHKADGQAWLRQYATRLDAELRAIAVASSAGRGDAAVTAVDGDADADADSFGLTCGGLELREVVAPRQCGQLFFLAYTVHPRIKQ